MTSLDYKILKDNLSGEDFLNALKKIDEDYPVQYVIGDVDFLGFKIKVDERVLIPRFETEQLTDKIIDYVKKANIKVGKILDVCTGSGCIAIALAKNFSGAQVVGVDKSAAAIEVARFNARQNEVEIEFICEDVLDTWQPCKNASIIVANPPYVKKGEKVSPNTRYEPQEALFPGDDDIIFYRTILEKCRTCLDDGGMIAFEIGCTQGEDVVRLAKENFPLARISLEKDYAGLDRFVFIFKEV